MKRDLTLEDIKLLVYDARMKPNATISELLEPFQPVESPCWVTKYKPKPFWTLDKAVIEVKNSVDELTFHTKCMAYLIYKPIEDGRFELLKHRFPCTYYLNGIIERIDLNKEIESIKDLLKIG